MTHLIIKLNTITENVTSELISKLYTNAKEIKDYEELNEIEDSLVELQGNLLTANAYDDEVTYLETKFPNLHINITVGRYIKFEDPEVQRVLLTTYGDGTGITMSDILAISNIGTLFRGNTTITKFNEFRYFTGIINRTFNWDTGDSFNGCTSLREITIPKNIENMVANNSAFYNCTSLETVIFDADCVISECPNFTGCTNLINISLPNSVTSIPGGGFYGCSSLIQFDTNNVTDIQSNTFKFCSSLISVVLSNVIHIGSEAFNNCQALTTVTFNTQTLTLIDGISFEGCSNLVINDLNLPNLTSLGSGAFRGTKIKQISNLGSITSISNDTFRNCSQLTSVSSLSTVTTIGSSSFRECSSLTNINLSNVTSIGDHAFTGCTSLTQFPCDPSIVTQIWDSAFENCTNMGLDTILELNLTLLTKCPQYGFYGTKFKGLILHWPSLSNLTFDGRYNIWENMLLLEYLDMSDTIAPIFDSTNLYRGFGFYQNPNITTAVFPATMNYLGYSMFTLRASVNDNTKYKYLILLSTTPPYLDLGSSNIPRSDFFRDHPALNIYVPDSVVSSYLSDSDWLQLGDGTNNFNLSDRVKGLSELPNGVWTTGLASLYLTSALLATS